MISQSNRIRGTGDHRIEIFAIVLCILFGIGLTGVSCQRHEDEAVRPESSSAEKAKKPKEELKGEELEISTVPQNGGFLRDLEKSLAVSFSREVRTEDFSFRISPDPGGWTSSWYHKNTKVLLMHSNPFIKSTVYTLTLEYKPDRLKREIRFTASGPSSLELIDEAESEGLIDRDTAWLYRMQGLHNSPELPEIYQSLAPEGCGTSVWKDFKRIRRDLKPETLAALRPYLVRPNHPDSIFNAKDTNNQDISSSPAALGAGFYQGHQKGRRPKYMWGHIDCSDKLRVWYRETWKAKARRACELLNGKRMYQRYKDLLGREPLSDATICEDEEDEEARRECLENMGGDGRLDIYLVYPWQVDKDWNSGWCRDVVDEGHISPSFILVNVFLEETPKNYFGAALAHELFHAFQSAFDAWEDNWWVEGTAVWAEHFIENSWDTEQDYLEDAFSRKKHQLLTLTSEEGLHDYGIYLFPFHLSQQSGDKIVADIWQACAPDEVDALQGVKKCVVDFEDCFKKFSLHTSDVGKHDGFYKDGSGSLALWTHHSHDAHKLKSGDVGKECAMTLPPLSAKYYSFHARPEFCKPDVTPHIRFDLKDFVENERVTVQAIIDPDGKAEDQDWSKLDEKVFCINQPEDKFEEITVIIASSEEKAEIEAVLKIEINAVGCDDCYATISRHDNAIVEDSTIRQEWDTEARVYVAFGEAIKSPLTSRYGTKGVIMYPIQSVRYLGGSALEKSESLNRTKIRTHRSMSAASPKLPTVQVDNQMLNPVFLMLFTNNKTGRVEYVYLPPIPVKIIWDDGKEEEFSVRGVSSLSGGRSTRPGLISQDYMVKTGDGILNLGGDGLVEETRSRGTTYEHSKKTFTWKITRRKSAAFKK
ncbi:hypothetical protein ACFLT2_06895 [Acidobacteriota bacterium]